jgi:hypothetical protein
MLRVFVNCGGVDINSEYRLCMTEWVVGRALVLKEYEGGVLSDGAVLNSARKLVGV